MDVCRILDIHIYNGKANTSAAVRKLGLDEKGCHLMPTPGGDQNIVCVSESGLYKLIMRSDKPEARVFQDWVTKDVLPSIRKTE